MEFVADDELVEITPKSIRVRKRRMKEQDRWRATRARTRLMCSLRARKRADRISRRFTCGKMSRPEPDAIGVAPTEPQLPLRILSETLKKKDVDEGHSYWVRLRGTRYRRLLG